MQICRLHGNEATRETLDVVTGEWFPICEECYPIFLRLAEQSDEIHAVAAEADIVTVHVPSGERFRDISSHDIVTE